MAVTNKPAYAPGKPANQKLPLTVRLLAAIALLLVGWLARRIGASYGASFISAALAAILVLLGSEFARRSPAVNRQQDAADPASVPELHQRALGAGGGAYLAHSATGGWIAAPPEVAGLVLAGPRAGQTSCVVIPALLSHPGPALCTSKARGPVRDAPGPPGARPRLVL